MNTNFKVIDNVLYKFTNKGNSDRIKFNKMIELYGFLSYLLPSGDEYEINDTTVTIKGLYRTKTIYFNDTNKMYSFLRYHLQDDNEE